MAETAKAFARRQRTGFFERFVPLDRPGIDIGCGTDPINQVCRQYDHLFGCGDATHCSNLPDNAFWTTYCMAQGTTVLTRAGYKNIESVAVGDEVWTHRKRWRPVTGNQEFPSQGKLFRVRPAGNSSGFLVTGNHPIMARHFPGRKCGVLQSAEFRMAVESGARFVNAEDLTTIHLTTAPIPDYIDGADRIDLANFMPQNELVNADKQVAKDRKAARRLGDRTLAAKYGLTRTFIRAWIYHGKSPFGYYVGEDQIVFHSPKPDVVLPRSVPIDGDLMRLIGYYLADGSMHHGEHSWHVAFHFNTEEMEYVRDVERIVFEKFGIRPTDIRQPKGTRGVNLRYASRPLFDIITGMIGPEHVHEKKVPAWALWVHPELQAELVEGHWRGDGTKRTGGGRSHCTVSKTLAEGLRHCLLRMGVFANLMLNTAVGRHTGVVRGRKIVGCGYNYIVQYDEKRSYNRGGLIHGGKLVSRIRSVAEVGSDLPVYGLQVEEDESYYAGGLMHHNSSHCLEHLADPWSAVRNWYRITAPGGHLILSVPAYFLYEKRERLPSRWNADHKWFFDTEHDKPPHILGLKKLIREQIPSGLLVHFEVCSEGWMDLGPDVHSVGEYSIEAVVRKPE